MQTSVPFHSRDLPRPKPVCYIISCSSVHYPNKMGFVQRAFSGQASLGPSACLAPFVTTALASKWSLPCIHVSPCTLAGCAACAQSVCCFCMLWSSEHDRQARSLLENSVHLLLGHGRCVAAQCSSLQPACMSLMPRWTINSDAHKPGIAAFGPRPASCRSAQLQPDCRKRHNVTS